MFYKAVNEKIAFQIPEYVYKYNNNNDLYTGWVRLRGFQNGPVKEK